MTNDLTVQEEIKALQNKKGKSAWVNRAKTYEESDNGQLVRPRTIFFGEVATGKGFVPTWEEPAFDMSLAEEGWKAIKSGSTDRGKVTVDPYIGKWQGIAHEYDDLVKGAIKSGSKAALKSAGVGLSSDFSAIDVLNLSNQLLNTELRDFVLEQSVTEVAVPQLVVSFDVYTRFLADRNIGEGMPPKTKLAAISRATYDLPKDGGAVALTFEAQARASHDLMRLHIDNLVSDLTRIKNIKIATEIETATDVAGEDLGANSGGLSTNVPLEKIGAVIDTMVSNNARPDTIVSHDKVFREYISNTWTAKYIQSSPQTASISNAKVITNVPGLPGFTWYIDNSKTSTIMSIFEKKSIVKFQGPVRTAVIRMDMEDVDAFRVFDFNLTKILIAGRARDLTGVTA